ncbi:MAG: Unknown protein [uncultured Thiotrichaceae bacterium]|uniref:Uncharacterized protein n=1 Tax=uncultured Thiotrichaceae bacterium TaxID=298394 RepID=A0A6S6U3M8_9GAMM|nr:MAG: Unknown protein [uncultured Thiotrichaceae bacterium]
MSIILPENIDVAGVIIKPSNLNLAELLHHKSEVRTSQCAPNYSGSIL